MVQARTIWSLGGLCTDRVTRKPRGLGTGDIKAVRRETGPEAERFGFVGEGAHLCSSNHLGNRDARMERVWRFAKPWLDTLDIPRVLFRDLRIKAYEP